MPMRAQREDFSPTCNSDALQLIHLAPNDLAPNDPHTLIIKTLELVLDQYPNLKSVEISFDLARYEMPTTILEYTNESEEQEYFLCTHLLLLKKAGQDLEKICDLAIQLRERRTRVKISSVMCPRQSDEEKYSWNWV